MRPLLPALVVAAAFVACKPEAPRASDAQVPATPPPTAATQAPSQRAAPPASAAPTSASAPFDTSCRADDDCAPAPGCCPAPCTSLVVNVKELPRIQAGLASCDRSLPCPSAGGCRTHAYLCNAGHCALVYGGEPGYRERH